MKPLHHHVQRLATRWLQAETATSIEQAQYVLEKAEKHQKRINKWHRRLQKLNLWKH